VEGDTHKCTQNDANTIWINQERAYCQGFNIWFVLLRLMTSELRSRLGRPRQDQGPLSYRSISRKEGSRRGDTRSLVSCGYQPTLPRHLLESIRLRSVTPSPHN
jgi:hypothetical protein